MSNTHLNRRAFLGFGAVAAASALTPLKSYAGSAAPSKPAVRTLSFFNTHTGERLSLIVQVRKAEGGEAEPIAKR